MTYKQYLSSKHWLSLRKKWVYDDFNVCCDICGRRKWTKYKRKTKKGKKTYKAGDNRSLLKFAIHHKHYNSLYKEERSDVMILCNRCHILSHDIDLAYHQSNTTFNKPYIWLTSTGWAYKKRKPGDLA